MEAKIVSTFPIWVGGVERKTFDIRIGDSLYYVNHSGIVYQLVDSRWGKQEMRTVRRGPRYEAILAATRSA